MASIIPVFYHKVIKNIIVAFGSIFDNVRYKTDFDTEIIVPLAYAPRSKFVEFFLSSPSFDVFDDRYTVPRMAFELTGMNFAPERYNNPLSRMVNADNTKYMFSRVPYDYSFNLYLATKKFEDSLKIIEQIVPFFTPELTVTLNDQVDLNLKTDIPVVLNSVGFNVDYEGTFETERMIDWTLGFTVKGYLYSDIRTSTRIKETIVNMSQSDMDSKFVQLISEVIPRSAEKDDPHEIVDTVNYEPNTWKTP